ncbi:hypothetical protein VTL71DRAFT_14969 [Oculimacula yallundae]|uniref:Hydrophobin n=1 Tax=Oculimacula yallundae TaxID=86028 RepID=A0ABR4CF87_9HELO
MQFSAIILPFLATLAIASPIAERQLSGLCGSALDTPQCCDVSVAGVANLNCGSPATATTAAEFKAECNAKGQAAYCCVLPIGLWESDRVALSLNVMEHVVYSLGGGDGDLLIALPVSTFERLVVEEEGKPSNQVPDELNEEFHYKQSSHQHAMLMGTTRRTSRIMGILRPTSVRVSTNEAMATGAGGYGFLKDPDSFLATNRPGRALFCVFCWSVGKKE